MKKTTFSVASDHAGFVLKEELKRYLRELGQEVFDHGTDSPDSVDYPDYAKKVALDVSKGRYARGLLVCATGIGMTIAANRFPSVRAALVKDPFSAEMSVRHNNANIIVFGAKTTSVNEAKAWLKIWLDTEFEGGRHERRLKKIEDLCK